MKATRQDITRLFRGIDAHTVLEILNSGPSVSDLEAAVLVLQGDDESLYGVDEHRRATVTQLTNLLDAAGLRIPGEEDELP